MPATTPSPAFVRDSSGKKAYVRSTVTLGSEHLGTSAGWDWYIDPRTGAYFVVAGR